MPASSRLKRDRPLVFFCVALVLALFQPPDGIAQTGLPLPSTPAALSPFQLKALLAFAPSGASFVNLTLTGTVKRTAGSLKETGTVTFGSASDGSYNETWEGAGGNHVIRCTPLTGARICTLTHGGKTEEIEGPFNQRMTPWFAPWLGFSLLSNLDAVATESTDSNGDQVLSFAPAFGSLAGLPTKTQQRLKQVAQDATVSMLYSASTALPLGMHYVEPLSSETSNAIDVSIVYGDFSLEQGFMVPHHIQRYIQSSLESDIHITSVSLN